MINYEEIELNTNTDMWCQIFEFIISRITEQCWYLYRTLNPLHCFFECGWKSIFITQICMLTIRISEQ